MVTQPLVNYGMLLMVHSGGKAKQRFIIMISVELSVIQERLWNTKSSNVFQKVILQHYQNITGEQEIKWRISKQLRMWEAENKKMLVQDKARTCKQYVSAVKDIHKYIPSW